MECKEVAIVGDVHFTHKVSSRIDDYLSSCLAKLREVISQHRVTIILGDFFNVPVIPFEYLEELYRMLKEFREDNHFVCSIMGNHDLFNEREDLLNKTALGWFKTIGVLDIIDNVNFVDTSIKGKYKVRFSGMPVSFEKASKYLKEFKRDPDVDIHILLSHNYYECEYEGFHRDDFINCEADAVFFGHEHKPLEGFHDVNGTKIYRCGSMMRNTANDYNLTRTPFYYSLSIEDGELIVTSHSFTTARPAVEVFKQSSFEQTNLRLNRFIDSVNQMTDVQLDKIVQMYNEKSDSNITVQTALKQLNTPASVLETIKDAYVELGEVF